MLYQARLINTNAEVIELPKLIELLNITEKLSPKSDNPDIYTLDAGAKSGGISVIKEFINWSTNKPFNNEVKLGIIYRAEKLTTEAQNALLKTLEEPYPDTVICLITKNSNALLPTINSRVGHISYNSGQSADNSEAALFANEFLTAELKRKFKIIEEINEKENRGFVLEFLEQIMQEVIDKRAEKDDKRTNEILEVCKLCYTGIKNSTNLKLTLAALAISIYEY